MDKWSLYLETLGINTVIDRAGAFLKDHIKNGTEIGQHDPNDIHLI